VALLRGINVGGKNSLPMKDLTEIFAGCGCESVRTYIQSGNVVFSSTPRCAAQVAEQVCERIGKKFGFRCPLVIRGADELGKIVKRNPFPDAADAGTLHVAFLADAPDPTRVDALDPKRSPGDSFLVRGGEIYLHLPNGVGRTKITNDYLDRTLATTSTLRNWRTVMKLLDMARELA